MSSLVREDFDSIYENMTHKPLMLSDAEYDCLEFVYNWYPSALSRAAVIALYNEFGMCIIYDMLARANMAMEHEQALDRARKAVEDAKSRLEALENKDLMTKEVLQEWLQN